MNIVKLQPAYKDYLWGGNKLREQYGKEADLPSIAESWELSTHSAGQSVIVNGPFEGKLFETYLKTLGKKVLGTKGQQFEDFPILIKLIDAKTSLSIQVHPDDTYALKKENSYGKTEMWYILSCDEGAFIYYGVKKELTKESLRDHIENNTITEVLNKVYVKPGDCFFIEAGTIHAIGAGIVICEIQQNSNITYRIYDYNRKDIEGNTRTLHIQQALEVCRLTPVQEKAEEQVYMEEYDLMEKRMLASCKYFTSYLYNIKESGSIIMDEISFKSIMVVEGEGLIKEGNEYLVFKKGDSFFVPAYKGIIEIEGKAQMIITSI